MCSQDNCNSFSLPWKIGFSKARVNAECEVLPSNQRRIIRQYISYNTAEKPAFGHSFSWDADLGLYYKTLLALHSCV